MEVKLEELCRSPPHPMAPDSPALQQQLTVQSAVLSFIHETCLHIDNLQSFQDERRMELEMQIRETMTNSPFRRLAEELQSDVDNHVRTITRLQSELSSCNKTIASLKTDVDKHLKTIASLQSELNSRNDTIASLKTDVEKHLKTIASLKTDVDKHLTKITNLESESTQLHKTLSLSQKQLVTTTADNDSLRKNLQEATTSVNSLSKEVEGLKRIIQQSNEQMEAEKKRAVQKNKSIMELQPKTISYDKLAVRKRILEMTSLPDYAREAIKVLYPSTNDRLNRLIQLDQLDSILSLTSEDIAKLKVDLSDLKVAISTAPISPSLQDRVNKDRYKSILTLYWHLFWDDGIDKDKDILIEDIKKIVKIYIDRNEWKAWA